MTADDINTSVVYSEHYTFLAPSMPAISGPGENWLAAGLGIKDLHNERSLIA